MKHIKGKITLALIAVIAIVVIILTSKNKLLTIGIMVAIALIAFAATKILMYMFSAYYKSTKESYFKVIFNKEKAFKYSIFKCFKKRLSGTVQCICDVYMPKVDGTLAKSDLVILNETGVYVIDIKNCSGKLAGAETGESWDYTDKGQTTQIPNPVIWNKLYMKWLKAYAKAYPHASYFSFVICKNSCDIKNILIKTRDVVVCKYSMLSKEIKRHLAQIGTSLATSEIADVYSQFKELTSKEKAESIKDVQGIQDTIFYK